MDAPEFSRIVQLKQVDTRVHRLEANAAERAALAKRFGLVAVERLAAEIELARTGDAVAATGTLEAEIVQSCAVTGEDLPVSIREVIALCFVPEAGPDVDVEELEIAPGELDEITFSGTQFDLGEAVAQSLGLAIDPYAIGPGAEAARKAAGLLDADKAGPFAALKGLKRE